MNQKNNVIPPDSFKPSPYDTTKWKKTDRYSQAKNRQHDVVSTFLPVTELPEEVLDVCAINA